MDIGVNGRFNFQMQPYCLQIIPSPRPFSEFIPKKVEPRVLGWEYTLWIAFRNLAHGDGFIHTLIIMASIWGCYLPNG